MRLFLAINLSERMKDALIAAQNEMFDRGIRGRFTGEENLHLTLAFLGESPDAAPVLDALSELRFSPFELRLEGIGCFGDLWWAGLCESAPLTSLTQRIRRALANSGISYDRKHFSPHITLIRQTVGRMPGIRIEQAAMTVDAVSLMRSDRGRNGMIYTELGQIRAES